MRHIAIAILCALGGCGSDTTPVVDDSEGNSAAVSQPAFAADMAGATTLVEDIGGPWTGGVAKDGQRDARTGGPVRMIAASGGSAQIHALPDSRVWRVRLIVHPPAGCGDTAPLKVALAPLVNTLAPATPFDAATRAAIEGDMLSTTVRTHNLPAIRVEVAGGCAPSLTATAL